MRVLICPDKFAGTLTAAEAAAAIETGWRRGAPDDELVRRPLADGGPGFLAVLASALDGRLVPVPTVDPCGRPVRAEILLVGDTAFLESAQAIGLHLVRPTEADPRTTSSYGLGVLMVAAVEAGARQVVIGLGGSATNDGGAGALAALGAAPLDDAGYALPYGPMALLGVAGLGGVPRLRGAALVGAVDVDNPLTGPMGASAVYGPQKGADPATVTVLDAALHRWGQVLGELPGAPPRLAEQPGAGAAGGIGAAILALGGRLESGAAMVSRLTGLDSQLDWADLVVVGEGSLDGQSARGKVVAAVAAAAHARGKPCLALAGQVLMSGADLAILGVTSAFSLVDQCGSVEQALAEPAMVLADLAQTVASRWAGVGNAAGAG